jgi:hypothetical protein
MEIDFQYALSDQDAKSRLEVLGKYLENKHGIKVTWQDEKKAKFSGRYLMVKIEGELAVGNSRATFKGEDPGFLLRARAKDYIQGKLAKYLDPKTALGDLPSE